MIAIPTSRAHSCDVWHDILVVAGEFWVWVCCRIMGCGLLTEVWHDGGTDAWDWKLAWPCTSYMRCLWLLGCAFHSIHVCCYSFPLLFSQCICVIVHMLSIVISTIYFVMSWGYCVDGILCGVVLEETLILWVSFHALDLESYETGFEEMVRFLGLRFRIGWSELWG